MWMPDWEAIQLWNVGYPVGVYLGTATSYALFASWPPGGE